MVSVKLFGPDDLFVKSLSVTVTVKVQGKVQAEFGVPVITAEAGSVPDGLIENPEGMPVALQLYGRVPPVPVTVAEYGTPTTPGVMVVVVMLGLSCANTSGAKLKTKVNRPNKDTATFNREIISAEPVATAEPSQVRVLDD
jgi:hypothetical protein